MKRAVPAVAERRATVAFAATVGSTWPEPPRPVRALYIWEVRRCEIVNRVETYSRTAEADEADQEDLEPGVGVYSIYDRVLWCSPAIFYLPMNLHLELDTL